MKKALLIILILIMYGVFSIGCTEAGSKTDGEVQPGKVGSGDGSQNSIEDRYKDKAVVLDTVVDVFREPDLGSERVTQVIFNQPVTVLEENEVWTKVKVVDGYTGWLKSKFINKDCASIRKEGFTARAVVTGKTKKVYSRRGGGVTLKEVVMGTELYIKGEKDRYYEVVLPKNVTGWVDSKDTIRVPVEVTIPKTSAHDFLATVNKFQGIPYLWGGVSAWEGLDCSGLVYICSRINGVDLPRDADQQYESIKSGPQGTGDLKPGDLIFFSTNEDLSDVSHVGIYKGEDEFIHASSSKGSVIITDLNTEYYHKRLKGIKRIFE